MLLSICLSFIWFGRIIILHNLLRYICRCCCLLPKIHRKMCHVTNMDKTTPRFMMISFPLLVSSKCLFSVGVYKYLMIPLRFFPSSVAFMSVLKRYAFSIDAIGFPFSIIMLYISLSLSLSLTLPMCLYRFLTQFPEIAFQHK